MIAFFRDGCSFPTFAVGHNPRFSSGGATSPLFFIRGFGASIIVIPGVAPSTHPDATLGARSSTLEVGNWASSPHPFRGLHLIGPFLPAQMSLSTLLMYFPQTCCSFPLRSPSLSLTSFFAEPGSTNQIFVIPRAHGCGAVLLPISLSVPDVFSIVFPFRV